MHDEVAEMGIVDGLLRLRLPGRMGCRVIREDPNHVELVQILELHIVERLELAAENKMQQLFLFGVVSHHKPSQRPGCGRDHASASVLLRTSSRNAWWRIRPAATSAPCFGSARL